jgi:sulfotransferase
MLFIRFEDLTENPEAELQKVYKYLELPYYKHDFNNIEQVTFEDDKFHGRYGDHKIQKTIKPVPLKAEKYLGEFICNQLYEKNKWYFDYFNYKK